MTYSEAKNIFNLGPEQFKRAIAELIEYGFLEITEVGQYLGKKSSLYFLSNRFYEYETEKFQIIQKKKRKIDYGFCKPKKN